MSLLNWLKVGLASNQYGTEVHNRIRNVSGSVTAVTIGGTTAAITAPSIAIGGTTATISTPVVVASGTTITLGSSTSNMGFFGAAVTAKPTGVTLNNVTQIAAALADLGLIGTTTP